LIHAALKPAKVQRKASEIRRMPLFLQLSK
jgi:hypothetical protein